MMWLNKFIKKIFIIDLKHAIQYTYKQTMSDIYNEIDFLSYSNYETTYSPMSTGTTKSTNFKTYPIMKFCSCKRMLTLLPQMMVTKDKSV
jgi:hypothetical protein